MTNFVGAPQKEPPVKPCTCSIEGTECIHRWIEVSSVIRNIAPHPTYAYPPTATKITKYVFGVAPSDTDKTVYVVSGPRGRPPTHTPCDHDSCGCRWYSVMLHKYEESGLHLFGHMYLTVDAVKESIRLLCAEYIRKAQR